ncbi:MAG: hypothetical protein OXD50_03565 [Chloroflexi bacterium]|nr:hypothetical protein [Chloroflexota bacterium]
MTTTERPGESSTKATYLTGEYEVFEDGRTYVCQMVEYLGDVYEECRRVLRPGEPVDEISPGPFIKKGDPGYDELVAYLDQYLVPADDADAG